MKHGFKKIAVCHGPTCGPNGARNIKQTLEDTLAADGVEITARECCGRCADHNSIVIDDSVTISHLDEKKIHEFIADPGTMIEKARKEEADLSIKIDEFFSSDDII